MVTKVIKSKEIRPNEIQVMNNYSLGAQCISGADNCLLPIAYCLMPIA